MTVDFNDYFWGEKNNGFDVLYHNMKFGLVASKELSDFLREKSNIEEHNSKLMTKLAHKAGSSTLNGTFAPIWSILRNSAERLSTLHSQMVQKLTELVKDVSKYADELHKKHKQVKEEEASTLEAVQSMQSSTLAVQKSKDLYAHKLQELEKLKKENASAKDIEKIETKLRKLQDDYKILMDKHNPIKTDFENKMSATCKKFQDIEEAHLRQMKEFLSTYLELLQNNHDMVGQVYTDFKRQFLDMTIDKLLEQFVLNKYTGLEKPEIPELELISLSSQQPQLQTNQNLINIMSSSAVGSTVPSCSSSLSIQHQQSRGVSPEPNPIITSQFQSAASSVRTNFKNWFTSNIPNRTGTASTATIDKNSGASVQNDTGLTNQNSNSILNLNSTSTNVTNQLPPTNNQDSNNIQSSYISPALSQLSEHSITSSSVPKSSVPEHQQLSQPMKQPQQQQQREQQRHQQQQKSSRRTTSLLNLFMSNSQGSRESREPPCVEALSAPTSPSEQQASTSTTNQNLHIGRNPLLRGSKFSGILRSRRDKAKTKKTKKKKDSDASSNKDEKVIEDNNDQQSNRDQTSSPAPVSVSISSSANNVGANSIIQMATSNSTGTAPIAQQQEVDDEGYSIQPKKESAWDEIHGKSSFYSDSDSDSDGDKPEKKIHVEIKPLNNGSAPISASVDELRATVGNISLSPIGVLSSRTGFDSENNINNNNTVMRMKRSQSVSQQIGHKPSNDLLGLSLFNQQHSQHISSSHTNNLHHQHPQQAKSPDANSTASTPTTTVHPYAPLQSPTLSVSNNSRYADLGDIFSEIGDISSSAPPSAKASSAIGAISGRQIPTPTSQSSIAIPRPPSRRSETAIRGRISPSSMSRADSVGSMDFRTAVGIGSSRGPSPLTIGMTDTIPLAVAFHEIIHAYFRGSDESRCQVKMSGDMMLSFPAGIVGVLANNPNPAKLGFRIKNIQNLENLIPNKQLVQIDKLQSTSFSTLLDFDMNALTALLRRQSEINPNASYFNVDILKYMIKPKLGATSCPFQLVSYWKCEATHTAIKIDYKYNSHAMASPSSLLNLSLSVPVDGGVKNVQSKPHSAWLGESNRLVWNFTDISQHSEGNGVGTLRARLEVSNGPSIPSTLNVQFNCEGTTLSGIEFELVGSGYRLSLVKRRFISGKYICEGDGISGTPTPST